jgi:hypothetical protein
MTLAQERTSHREETLLLSSRDALQSVRLKFARKIALITPNLSMNIRPRVRGFVLANLTPSGEIYSWHQVLWYVSQLDRRGSKDDYSSRL